MSDELAWMPATEMRAAIRERRLSPVEVTQALLDRIDRLNPALNAYTPVTHEMAAPRLGADPAAPNRPGP